MPILEALNTGCHVVSYNNSNVPQISGGFATLVPTGDTAELANAIAAAIEKTRSEEWKNQKGYEKYRADVTDYCNQFQPDSGRRRFLSFVNDISQGTDYAARVNR